MGGAAADSEAIWAALSQNQQAFFKGNVAELKAARSENTLCAAMFAISIGILIMVQSGCIYMLKTKREEINHQNIEWDSKEMKSRQIERVTQHEKCKFPYIKNFEDSQLSVIQPKKSKKNTRTDQEEEHEHDEYSFDASEMDYAINDHDDHDEEFDDEEGADQYGYGANDYPSGTGGNYDDDASGGGRS